jgi:hypothetical protein
MEIPDAVKWSSKKLKFESGSPHPPVKSYVNVHFTSTSVKWTFQKADMGSHKNPLSTRDFQILAPVYSLSQSIQLGRFCRLCPEIRSSTVCTIAQLCVHLYICSVPVQQCVHLLSIRIQLCVHYEGYTAVQ